MDSISASASIQFTPTQKNDGLQITTLEKAKIDRMLLSSGFEKAAKLPYAHSLLVLRDGKLVAEAYFNGYSIESPNNLKSITKSVTSALMGIALDKRILKSIDQPIVELIPELPINIENIQKNKITLKHFLTMSAGFDANDDLPDLNCSSQLDFVKCVFERPLIHKSGDVFSYTSAYVDILSKILTDVTHVSTREFAESHLFGPLGIKILGWTKNARGYYLGESELFLTSRDMAKFGELFLNQGTYKSKQLISKQWVKASTSPILPASEGNGEYGFLWWIKSKAKVPFIYAWGFGGQYIYVVPTKKMVIVMTNDFKQRRPQAEIRSIIEDHIISAANDD